MDVANKLPSILVLRTMQLTLEEGNYGCSGRYTDSQDSCNFLVWESEIEHQKYIRCECGTLCKKVNISQKGLSPVFKFICINRYNKVHPGCKVYIDA